MTVRPSEKSLYPFKVQNCYCVLFFPIVFPTHLYSDFKLYSVISYGMKYIPYTPENPFYYTRGRLYWIPYAFTFLIYIKPSSSFYMQNNYGKLYRPLPDTCFLYFPCFTLLSIAACANSILIVACVHFMFFQSVFLFYF